MQSLYSKVLKNTTVINNGKKKIVTEYTPPVNAADIIEEKQREDNAKEFIESYENLAKSMLENARRKSEQILSKAYEDAEKIEAEAYPMAYEKGYEEGKKIGYDEAYKSGYEENIKKANKEREELIKNAQSMSNEIINSAKEEYIEYLEEKKVEIKKLIKEIIESIIAKEFKEEDGLNSMVMEILEEVKASKTVIIRCNNIYKDELEENISKWKENNAFRGDIFVIKDDSLEEGNVCIEKDNGKININKDSIFKKIGEILNG
ncbi:fliH protein [uncultured Clostridium sp.]|uniref:FliH/SctL family protein n=1 Tax=uncultured Clostridium sp. TaxID=59620 RepID=UPI0028E94CDD|nr:fliH protein [uncultured Clostridium sp.]